MTSFAADYLEKILEKDQVPHLLLFSGSSLLNATDFARKYLLKVTGAGIGIEQDIHTLKVSGKIALHTMKSIQELIDKLHLHPYAAKGKVAIIEAADRMLVSGANAILKIIEEPPPHTLILLLSSKPEQLLPTIRSRAHEVRFERVEKEIEYSELYAFLEKENLTFYTCAQEAAAIDLFFQKRKKEIEKELQKGYAPQLKELSGNQKEQLEKELEGSVASLFTEEVHAFLIELGEFYKQRHPEMIELVSKALSEAKLALLRSTSLKNVLEGLFLKLV